MVSAPELAGTARDKCKKKTSSVHYSSQRHDLFIHLWFRHVNSLELHMTTVRNIHVRYQNPFMSIVRKICHVMSKPAYTKCEQERHKSACTAAQSYQRLCYSLPRSFRHIRPLHFLDSVRGARWLSGRVSDSGARGPGFETYRRRVVSLSKTLYSPKVLVNYPGCDGSVPT